MTPASSASTLRLGIDLGGTKIEGVVLAGTDEVARLRVPAPRGDYVATLEAIAALITSLEHQAGAIATVGIGIPGTLSPATGFVKNANSVWLIGRPLQADLEARLGRRVRLANDANCFAVSEASDGAAQGAHVVFGVILGTGTGAGVVVGGAVLEGPSGLAGEWGHNPLPWADAGEWPGRACYCGRTGCIETFLSGPGMAADHEAHTGEALSPETLVARAADGDRGAADTLARYESRLARGLASVINLLDPDVIVLGGGLSNVDRLYASVPALWGRWVFGGEVRTRLVRAVHGDASGVRGAAWLWPLPR